MDEYRPAFDMNRASEELETPAIVHPTCPDCGLSKPGQEMSSISDRCNCSDYRHKPTLITMSTDVAQFYIKAVERSFRDGEWIFSGFGEGALPTYHGVGVAVNHDLPPGTMRFFRGDRLRGEPGFIGEITGWTP